ncbi:MAG: TetR/AcrR family transcriptional regulator [Pseudomonadota bacterium]
MPPRKSTAAKKSKATAQKKKPKPKRALKAGQIERTKNAVLDATTELLGEVAYGKITVDLISERCGASRSTIYRYWKTIPDLVSDAFERALDPDPELPQVDDLREQLVTLYSHVPNNLTQKQWGRVLPSLVAASNTDPEFAGRLQKISDHRRANIRRFLRRAIRNGDLKPDTNIEWMIDALSAIFYYRHLITGKSLHDKGLVEWVVDMVLAKVQAV